MSSPQGSATPTPDEPGTSAPPSTAAPSAGSAPATTPAAGKPLNPALLKALGVALSCEQAAVWCYGLIAAYLPDDLDLISGIEAGHLARRDATAALITAGRGKATPPAAAYDVPALSTPASARALAATLENGCAAAWRTVLGSTDDTGLRTTALAGLSDSAVWLTQIKLAGKISPSTVPFPGQS
ncbi:ferritin-like domain-containing protein [Nakamurella endophytica]|uniref:DUF4439 domain-containing protein n=1 Tax=Nakamurella endophytica TaxID=1748367 RepID=A0A917SRX4_9ACTN|nr:ferritin-like domain-containing protein [Nakamurella endophytica]GGL95534.1 hypothetical protein GCM10011594_13960 [Nakamurella endophytica]